MTLLKAIKESPCLFSTSAFSSIVMAASAVKPWSLSGSKVIYLPFTNKLAGTSSPFCSSLILSPYTTVASLSGWVKRILTLEKSRNGSKSPSGETASTSKLELLTIAFSEPDKAGRVVNLSPPSGSTDRPLTDFISSAVKRYSVKVFNGWRGVITTPLLLLTILISKSTDSPCSSCNTKVSSSTLISPKNANTTGALGTTSCCSCIK